MKRRPDTPDASGPAIPAVPEHVQPYVDVLGIELAIKMLLDLGGAPVYLPDTRTSEDSLIVQTVGHDRAIALGKRLGRGSIRVPLAKKFIAAYYLSQGVPLFEIARRLHMSEVTIRRWLPDRPNAQLSLFE